MTSLLRHVSLDNPEQKFFLLLNLFSIYGSQSFGPQVRHLGGILDPGLPPALLSSLPVSCNPCPSLHRQCQHLRLAHCLSPAPTPRQSPHFLSPVAVVPSPLRSKGDLCNTFIGSHLSRPEPFRVCCYSKIKTTFLTMAIWVPHELVLPVPANPPGDTLPSGCHKHTVLVSSGCRNKRPQTWWFKVIQYSLVILEARSPKWTGPKAARATTCL